MSTVADLTAQAADLIAEQLKDAKTPAITSSFQAECVVLTDLLLKVRPDLPVLFLETFHHFAQTLAYRDEMAKRYNLNLVILKAAQPKIGLKLLRVLVQRLRRADEKIGGLVLLDVNGRVARLLLDMADEGGGPRITRRLTHHTIAQMIGSSRETVSRAMRELVDRGLIEVTRREISIRNRDGLATLAGSRA